MIWANMLLLGVLLWLSGTAIVVLVLRNRSMRKREGNVPAWLRIAPDKRWTRGHSLWVHDVWAFRGSPAVWSEKLLWVTAVTFRRVTADEGEKLRGLGDNPTVAVLAYDGGTIEVAASAEHRAQLVGPFATSISLSELDAAGAESFSPFPITDNRQKATRP